MAYLLCQTFLMICNVMLTVYCDNPLWLDVQNDFMEKVPLHIHQHGVLLIIIFSQITHTGILFTLKTSLETIKRPNKVLTAELHSCVQPGLLGSEMIYATELFWYTETEHFGLARIPLRKRRAPKKTAAISLCCELLIVWFTETFVLDFFHWADTTATAKKKKLCDSSLYNFLFICALTHVHTHNVLLTDVNLFVKCFDK